MQEQAIEAEMVASKEITMEPTVGTLTDDLVFKCILCYVYVV